jgi:lipopolysaccharide export system ATP-binding protein
MAENMDTQTASDPAGAQPGQRPASRPKVVEGGGGLFAENLGKTFKRRPVVRGVSMSVKRGEVVGLLGPNGAGKTTCFYMITGLIPVDYGTISIDGHDVTRLPMYQRARLGLGYLPQEASIFRGLSVEQNLRAVVELVERNKDKQQALIDDLLTEFNITHIRNAPALALSGGERRRVEIARALATGPAFMLLDEPFAGIDPLAIADIRELVIHLKDRGLGVLITDHNVRETLDIIDRAYIIHEGEVLIEGAPSDIVGDKDVRRVYLGDRFQM